MGSTPQLAVDTCARRLRGLGISPGATPAISWYGPAPVEHPGSEAAVQAVSGLMAVHGRDAGVPRRLGLEVASVAAGILAAQGTLVASIAGRPPPSTSVLQAAVLLLSHYFVVATGLGDALPGPALPAPGPPFRTDDGRWFEIETLDPACWKAFWTELGAGGADLGRAWTVFRWRYERAACSLPGGLHEATARCTLEQVDEVAARTGMSLCPVRDHDVVVAEIGPDAGHPLVEARPGAGGPLTGLRVVEATSRIQGPFAGMLLRMLGAEVTRVQPPAGDYGRAAVTLHRQKASVTLDLDDPSARAELVELVHGADVFLHNWRPGRAEGWGLTFDDLTGGHRGLVYAEASGWGDHRPPGRPLGTDYLVQAWTGLGHGLSPEGDPPFPSRMILCDLFGALVTAEGVGAGLYQRAQRGGSWHVRSSLLAGAMALQAHVRNRPVWAQHDRPARSESGWSCGGVPVAEDLASVAADPRLAGLFEPVGEGVAPRAPWSPP